LQLRIDTLIKLALEEDVAYGDLTAESIFPSDHLSSAVVIARQDMIVCGLDIAKQVFLQLDPAVEVELKARDGDRVEKDSPLMHIEGNTIALLSGERTALNFLQRLSGIATLASQYAELAQASGNDVRIVDTRKTTPGWRALEKYAVRCGGCFNHRSSLGEHVLIKENHIQAAGSIAEAVKRSRVLAPHCAKIEVETETLDDVREAIKAGAEVIMLDNMSPALAREAIDLIDGAAIVELSGGITLATLQDFAMPGVDVISIGALTHSATAADLSMIINPQSENQV
jgi:nicotinate-nucleotide pyrophosphorylase (carboxylating)